MIGKLTGLIDTITDDHCIIDVAGVGYIVYCPLRMLLGLQVGALTSIIIHMLVKEDQLTLYGFENNNGKTCFLTLQTVQGVGAKMALAMLNTLTPQDIATAIMAGDINAFRQVSGIGPKLAARIVNELKSHKDLFNNIGTNPILGNSTATEPVKNVVADAISALANLGFSRSEALPVVTQIYSTNANISFDELIRNSLGKLSSR